MLKVFFNLLLILIKNMSEQNSNKNNFLFGLIAGIAIISTIAFIALLIRGVNKSNSVNANNKTVQEKQINNRRINSTGKITINANDHIRGNKDAKITLVEFSDFQCPYCKRFHPTMQEIMKNYNGQVRWVYRNFPLSFHRNAQKSAEAAECAGDQGKFWEYADRLFTDGQSDGSGLNSKDLQKYAKDLNLDLNKFNDCVDSNKFANKIKADAASGRALGITGTPGTILIDKDGNTQLMKGSLPYSQIKAKIDSALK